MVRSFSGSFDQTTKHFHFRKCSLSSLSTLLASSIIHLLASTLCWPLIMKKLPFSMSFHSVSFSLKSTGISHRVCLVLLSGMLRSQFTSSFTIQFSLDRMLKVAGGSTSCEMSISFLSSSLKRYASSQVVQNDL